jgi:predicted ArsR family transcriptional regulator
LVSPGKDARCYPSLEKVGKGLGVSDRQARDDVKELERAGLIAVEQRGLRKTNVYLFLWTADWSAAQFGAGQPG